jgi:hypothetical protein
MCSLEYLFELGIYSYCIHLSIEYYKLHKSEAHTTHTELTGPFSAISERDLDPDLAHEHQVRYRYIEGANSRYCFCIVYASTTALEYSLSKRLLDHMLQWYAVIFVSAALAQAALGHLCMTVAGAPAQNNNVTCNKCSLKHVLALKYDGVCHH